MTQYPRVRVELESTNRHVDLVADHVDVAIRIELDYSPALTLRSRSWPTSRTDSSPIPESSKGGPPSWRRPTCGTCRVSI